MSNFWIIIIVPLAILTGIALLIARTISRRRERRLGLADEQERALVVATSARDFIGQLFLVLSVFFFGLTLLAFNRSLSDPVSWRWVLLMTSVAGLAVAYYFKTALGLAVGLLMTAGWWGSQAVFWAMKENTGAMAVLSGLALIALLFYLLGRQHEARPLFKGFSVVYSLLGLISITVGLLFFSTMPGLKYFEGLTEGGLMVASWHLTLFFLALVVLNVALIFRGLAKKALFKAEALAVFALMALFVVIVFLPYQEVSVGRLGYSKMSADLSGTGIVWALIFNLFAFLEMLGIIFLGYHRRENYFVNMGVAFFAVFIVVKYFDWFFKFLDKSLFFIIGGILLFVVAWLMDRGRRYIMKTIRQEQVQEAK